MMHKVVGIFALYCLAIMVTTATGYLASGTSDDVTGSLHIGSITAANGQSIEVPITLDMNVPIAGIHINLAYDGRLLLSGTGKSGKALPEGWQVFTNEAEAGKLRTITLNFAGESFIPTSEPVLVAEFEVASNVTPGEIPITVDLLSVIDANSNQLNLSVNPGSVTVTGEPGWDIPEFCCSGPVSLKLSSAPVAAPVLKVIDYATE